MQNSEQKLNVYDIANAGPRNRFVVRTSKGPMLVHNCILGLGYGVGAGKLQGTLANGFIKVNMPLNECQRIVKLYRDLYANIPALWKQCQQAIDRMWQGYDSVIGVGCPLIVNGRERSIGLPNGLKLWYSGMEATPGQYGNEYSYQKRKGIRARLYGGALTENIIQSLARIIVSYQMVAISHWLEKQCAAKNDGKIRRIVNMVHDEVVVVVPEDEALETKAQMEKIMKTPLKWCKGLPVSCEADIGKTYGDAK